MVLSLVQPVRDRYKSHVRWADQPNGDIVVFVPGFTGNATATWVEFPSMLSRSSVRDTDILFFGHNGGRSQLESIVGLLSAYIEKLWNQPSKFATYPRTRSEQFRYRRIFLCGHSMGCVAIRDVVVSGAEGAREWALHTTLLMFAPAHKGISGSLMMLEKFAKAMHVVGQWPMAAFQYVYPVTIDLRPGSSYLRSLESRTTILSEGGKFLENVIPRFIAFGEMDKVVEQDRFSLDPYPPTVFENRDHVSVCKPISGKFEEPFELVAGVLQ